MTVAAVLQQLQCEHDHDTQLRTKTVTIVEKLEIGNDVITRAI